MPNVNGPMGLRPIRHRDGSFIKTSEYSIASAYASNICKGDPVQMTGTGRNIILAEAGNVDNIGVFDGCRYIDSTGKPQFSAFWPANTVATDIVALVYDDPDIIFEAQCDTLAEGDLQALADWDGAAGSTSTGLSGQSVVASVTATTGKSLRLERLIPRPDNAFGAYAKVEVSFATHVLKGVVAGVGGI